MSQIKSFLLLPLFLGLFLLGGPSNVSAQQKEIFVDSKCTKCHSITAAGIEKKKGGSEDEDEDADDGEKTEPPDLSHVGKDHDAAFIEAFLKKKANHVPHGDAKSTAKHKVKFKGSDEDLVKLSAWLAAMK